MYFSDWMTLRENGEKNFPILDVLDASGSDRISRRKTHNHGDTKFHVPSVPS